MAIFLCRRRCPPPNPFLLLACFCGMKIHRPRSQTSSVFSIETKGLRVIITALEALAWRAWDARRRRNRARRSYVAEQMSLRKERAQTRGITEACALSWTSQQTLIFPQLETVMSTHSFDFFMKVPWMNIPVYFQSIFSLTAPSRQVLIEWILLY